MKKIFVIMFLLIAVAIPAQKKDAKKIIDAVHQKYNKINDYQAEVTIKLNMSAIKVPEMKAKVFFKKPDKLKIESDGFAMLPKQGLKFSPSDFLKGDYTSLYIRSEKIDNRKVDVIKTIPTSDSSDVVLSTLWIDSEGLVIKKVETTGKKGGTTQIQLSYDSYEFGLPSKVNISFDMGDVKTPENFPAKSDPDDHSGQERKRSGMRGVSLNGSVTMTYMNYKINKGIPDSIFDKKEKKK